MNCAQMRELSLDFLYDELAPDDRAALQAHAQGCPACTAELASLQGTLQNTRSALRGVLDQEPPAGVRARLHGAARAHIESGAQRGLLERVWKTLRRPWLLPMLAAATAVVIGLSRQLSPQPAPLEARPVEFQPTPVEPKASLDEADEGAERAAPQAAYAPAPERAASHDMPAAHERFGAPSKPAETRVRAAPGLSKRASEARKSAATDARDRAANVAPAAAADAVAEADPETEATPVEAPRAVAARRDEASPLPRSRGPAAPAKRAAAASETFRERQRGAFAEAPPAAQLEDTRNDVLREAWAEPEASVQGRAGTVPPASPRAPRLERTREQTRAIGALEDSATSDNARAPSLAASGPAQDKQPARTLADRIARANEAYEQRRWETAAIAYHALLRDYPGHSAVRTWKQRLSTAQMARDK